LQVSLAILFFLLMASVFVTPCAEYITALSKSSYDFTLTASGQAHDRFHQEQIDVALLVMGTADGKYTTVINLHVKGGDLRVDDYEALSVSRGYGILIQHSHYIYLTITITSRYGGQIVVWFLRGKTWTLSGNSLPVSLSSSRVILPLQDYPNLDNLKLKGTITLD